MARRQTDVFSCSISELSSFLDFGSIKDAVSEKSAVPWATIKGSELAWGSRSKGGRPTNLRDVKISGNSTAKKHFLQHFPSPGSIRDVFSENPQYLGPR